MTTNDRSRTVSQTFSVYALIDPRDGGVRYIGMSKNPYLRYGQHITETSTANIAKSEWIRDLAQNEYLPTLLVIEKNLDKPTALVREKYWIQIYLEQGANILNLRDADLLPIELRV